MNVTFNLILGEILMKLGRLKEASEVFKNLIDQNAENWYYFEAWKKLYNLVGNDFLSTLTDV